MKIVAALFAAVLLLAGCGASDDGGGTKPEPSSSSAAPTPDGGADADEPTTDEGTVVEVVIKDGKAVPQGKRVEVKVGEKVTLDVRSDADEEIHVHSSPEHTYQVGAGDTISETFSVRTPGQVAVEAHHLGVTIVQLVVRP